jgi:CheY-like chemotaxis protein
VNRLVGRKSEEGEIPDALLARVELNMAVAELPTSVSRRMLVVDDNADSLESTAMLLGMLGHQVVTAVDGVDAVRQAEAFKPEVILMDLGLPKLDGHGATRQIRQQPWGSGIIIVAVTGWGQESDRIRSREAGCDAHLVKPIDVGDLEHLLTTLPPRQTEPSEQTS